MEQGGYSGVTLADEHGSGRSLAEAPTAGISAGEGLCAGCIVLQVEGASFLDCRIGQGLVINSFPRTVHAPF